jgi:drug/metabolite transporter (DMT)-like permease
LKCKYLKAKVEFKLRSNKCLLIQKILPTFALQFLSIFDVHTGEISALGVAFCWTLSALFFEMAGSRIGSLAVNVIRLVMAILLLGIATWITRGLFFPLDATPYQWFWLSLSGFIGFFLGDLCLFYSYTLIGSRMAQLVMTLAPPITAFVGFVFLGERLSLLKVTGILVTVSGIFIAMLGKETGEKLNFKVPLKGFLFALGGAVGQALGLVISKKGIGNYDAMAATQIRALTGGLSFIILVTILRRWGNVRVASKDRKGLRFVFIGSFFGPFVGVALSLYAIQHTSAGVAATLIGLVPILIIVPSSIMFKQRITLFQVIGAFISVGGCVLLFLT